MAVTGAFVHLFNNMASALSGMASKKLTKEGMEKNLNLDGESKIMIISTAAGFVGGVVSGAISGFTALGPLGALIGGVAGGTYGLATGMFSGYLYIRFGRIPEVQMMGEHVKTLKNNVKGYIEYEKRKHGFD
ncbi:MAG: hypothetical protein C0625_08075 [Arcobacter sp.]|nr:MAG: hypothetical protein C0625_08075 [Arcobacter sp.]